MSDPQSKPVVFVGIDVAKDTHVAAAIGADGAVLFTGRRVQGTRDGLVAFVARLRQQADPAHTRIAMEATGHYWIQLNRFLLADGWQVAVLNPVLTSAKARVNSRGRITDADDALAIARTIRDADRNGAKASHLYGGDHGHLRELTRRRTQLGERRVEEILHLQALVEVLFPEFAAVIGCIEKPTALAVLAEAASADRIAAVSARRLSALITKTSRGQLDGSQLARELHTAARVSLAAGYRDPGREAVLTQVITSLRHLIGELAALDDAIEEVAARLEADRQRLRALPGMGPITIPTILAEYGDLSRFIAARSDGTRSVNAPGMVAHAGLDARPQESGDWKGVRKMSKRGSVHLRRALMLAAARAIQSDPWCAGLARRYRHQHAQRGYWLAVSHVARHLIHAFAAALKYPDFTWKRFTEERRAATRPAA